MSGRVSDFFDLKKKSAVKINWSVFKNIYILLLLLLFQFFYILFLALYSHTLIFESGKKELTPFDMTLLVWALSFLVEELMQVGCVCVCVCVCGCVRVYACCFV